MAQTKIRKDQIEKHNDIEISEELEELLEKIFAKNIKVSGQPGNQLQMLEDGLYISSLCSCQPKEEPNALFNDGYFIEDDLFNEDTYFLTP